METDAAVDKVSELQFLSTAAWKSLLAFHTVSTGTAAMNLKQQNRTDHLLQKPDISICYRHRSSLRLFRRHVRRRSQNHSRVRRRHTQRR